MTELKASDVWNSRLHEDPNEWFFINDEGTIGTLTEWLNANTAPDVEPFSVGTIIKLCMSAVGDFTPTQTGYLKRVSRTTFS